MSDFCYRCLYVAFTNASDFVDHLKRVHRVDVFICILCQMKFTRACAYKRHLTTEYEKINRTLETRSHVSSVLSQSNDFDELPFADDDVTISSPEVKANLLVELPLYDDGPRQDPLFEDNILRLVLDLYGSVLI